MKTTKNNKISLRQLSTDKLLGIHTIKTVPIKPEPRSETLKKVRQALG